MLSVTTRIPRGNGLSCNILFYRTPLTRINIQFGLKVKRVVILGPYIMRMIIVHAESSLGRSKASGGMENFIGR
jgi:hypothetical protein